MPDNKDKKSDTHFMGRDIQDDNNLVDDSDVHMVSDKNNLIQQFDKFLMMNYSNQKTRDLYHSACKRFFSKIEESTGQEPTELTQDMLDTYAIYLNSMRRINPFYKGVVKSIKDCFDPEGKLKLKVRKDRSREAVEVDEYDFLQEEDVQKLISGTSDYMSVTLKIFFETGLRKMELLNLDLNNPEYDMDLVKRRIRGIGKGNKEFIVHFSEDTAHKTYEWLKKCKDATRPFLIYKSNGQPYKNQDYEYWYRLKKEAKFLGIKLPNDREVHPHAMRHSLGRFLRRDKNWDIAQISKKLRHSDPKTTMRYSSSSIEEIEEKEDNEVFNNGSSKQL